MVSTEDTQAGAGIQKSEPREPLHPRIVVVGVCGSGKTLLTGRLKAAGYDARPVAQEHSLVPRLFLKSDPDFVILLEARDETVALRKSSSWKPSQLREQRERLKLAHEKADIVLETDDTTPDELLLRVRRVLDGRF